MNTTLLTATYTHYFPNRPCSDIPELIAFADNQLADINEETARFIIHDWLFANKISAMD